VAGGATIEKHTFKQPLLGRTDDDKNKSTQARTVRRNSSWIDFVGNTFNVAMQSVQLDVDTWLPSPSVSEIVMTSECT
jgi:hypothetical protein